MIKTANFGKHFLLSLFFVVFAGACALGWEGGETRMERLAVELEEFVERARANYVANSAVQEELKGLIDKHSDAQCSSDFGGFLSALDELAARAEEAGSMNPGAVAEFRQVFEDELKMGCPGGMVLIEGIFCIDKHEYPGKIGSPPIGGFSWNEAVAKCAEAGKHLCSGDEWRRTCRGNIACADSFFGDGFNREKCGVLPQYVAPGAGWKLEDRPECMSAYGVDDMAGGLWEWTRDDFRRDMKVLRSGASPKDPEPSCDETMWAAPGSRMGYAGFRCCAAPMTKTGEPEEETGGDSSEETAAGTTVTIE